MPNSVERQRGWRAIASVRDFATARLIESHIHASSFGKDEYLCGVRRVCANLELNEAVETQAAFLCDETISKNTIIETIEEERKKRATIFKQMLHEKYEALNDQQFNAVVKCRRCGGSEIVFDEKQTRSADESATIFCACSKCGLRWVIR